MVTGHDASADPGRPESSRTISTRCSTVLPPHISPLRCGPSRTTGRAARSGHGPRPRARGALPGPRGDPERTSRSTEEDIDYVVQRIGAFGDDNRAGIERTLHRISAIRNREGRDRRHDLPRRPRRLRHHRHHPRHRRVGPQHPDDGPAGRRQDDDAARGGARAGRRPAQARRSSSTRRTRSAATATSRTRPSAARGACRCPRRPMQHAVMIEAVENHMPEVIVIDEIGTELEAQARAHDRRARRAAGRHGARQHARKPDAEPDPVRPDRRHPDASPWATRRRAAAAPRSRSWSARRRRRSTSWSRSRTGTASRSTRTSPTWSTRCCAATPAGGDPLPRRGGRDTGRAGSTSLGRAAEPGGGGRTRRLRQTVGRLPCGPVPWRSPGTETPIGVRARAVRRCAPRALGRQRWLPGSRGGE